MCAYRYNHLYVISGEWRYLGEIEKKLAQRRES